MGRINMVSARAEWSFHARLVRTSLVLLMLSACSQESTEQEPGGSLEPAQQQRAGAQSDCRDEVAAAFERLRTSGRPYRREVTSDISDPFIVGDRKTFRGTAEFLPPDRTREITNVVPGHRTDETIRVGQRAWSNWAGGWPWGWFEWDFRLRDRWRDVAKDGPADGANGTAGLMIFEAGKDFSFLRNPVIRTDDVFKCLGEVKFKDTAYLGYQARLEMRIATIAIGPWSESRQQELSRKLQQMPQKWRTVFVDLESRLPVYDLVAQENQLDNPSSKERYTYPNDIKIEPPLWCRVGLCRSVLW
jgi:hypothetical protein